MTKVNDKVSICNPVGETSLNVLKQGKILSSRPERSVVEGAAVSFLYPMNARVPHPLRYLRRVGYHESRYRVAYPTLANNAKDPGFLPRSAGQDRVCAFL